MRYTRKRKRRATSRRLGKAEYEALATFRSSLRRFLAFTAAAAREAGLTPQQHQLLLAVLGQRGRSWATISELADALQIRHHTAVELVDRCENAGWVRRAAGEDDRRQVRVTLTPIGERSTHVDLSIDQRGLLGRPIGWLARRTTRRYLRLEAEGLRRRSESLADQVTDIFDDGPA